LYRLPLPLSSERRSEVPRSLHLRDDYGTALAEYQSALRAPGDPSHYQAAHNQRGPE
jgi:hypothetical protein